MFAGVDFSRVVVIAHSDMRPHNPVTQLHAVKIIFVDRFKHQIEQQFARFRVQRIKPYETVWCDLTTADIAA